MRNFGSCSPAAIFLACVVITAGCSKSPGKPHPVAPAPSPLSASSVDVTPNAPKRKQWWIANSSFTACNESEGPAAKLDEFTGFTDKPYTRDFRNSAGSLNKVEVINPIGGGKESVWTYYTAKSECESEQINATNSLADKYR